MKGSAYDFKTEHFRRLGEIVYLVALDVDDEIAVLVWHIDSLGEHPDFFGPNLAIEWAEVWDDWIDTVRLCEAYRREVLQTYAESRFPPRF